MTGKQVLVDAMKCRKPTAWSCCELALGHGGPCKDTYATPRAACETKTPMSTDTTARDWIPVSPYAPDWETPNGMIEWIAARLVEVERSVPSGDGQSIVQQIIDTELPMLRGMIEQASA